MSQDSKKGSDEVVALALGLALDRPQPFVPNQRRFDFVLYPIASGEGVHSAFVIG